MTTYKISRSGRLVAFCDGKAALRTFEWATRLQRGQEPLVGRPNISEIIESIEAMDYCVEKEAAQ